jgi:chaperonin GroES
MSTLTPILDRVVIKRDEEDKKSKGGVLLPETGRVAQTRGKVVAVGPGRFTISGERMVMEVAPGDRVLFVANASHEFDIEDEKYLVIGQEQILCVIRAGKP